MPTSLSAGDRKILIIAGGIFILLVVGAAIFGSPSNETQVPSSYSVASKGGKAAYLLLQETGYHVERWEKSPVELGSGAGRVLILAQPAYMANKQEQEGFKNFLDSGGEIIAIGANAALSMPDNSYESEPVSSALWKKFEALTPSGFARVAPRITTAEPVYWKAGSSVTALYGEDNKAVVVRYSYGKGKVIWWAAATPLSNSGITQSDNLNFFLACIGDKQSVTVLWDEYFHGYGQHEATSEKSHPLLIVLLLQFAVLGLAVLFTFSRRSGPLRPMAVEARLSPLEFVETLGGLYQHARAASVAVDVYYHRFQYWLTRRLGLANNASPDELANAVRERWNFKDEQFAAVLQSAAAARYQSDLNAKDALRLVQSLHSYAVRLKLFPAPAKEKF